MKFSLCSQPNTHGMLATKFAAIWQQVKKHVHVTAKQIFQQNCIKISLRRQNISSHDIDYIEYVGPYLIWVPVSYQCGGMT